MLGDPCDETLRRIQLSPIPLLGVWTKKIEPFKPHLTSLRRVMVQSLHMIPGQFPFFRIRDALTPKRMAEIRRVEVSRADLHHGHRRPSRMLRLTGRDE